MKASRMTGQPSLRFGAILLLASSLFVSSTASADTVCDTYDTMWIMKWDRYGLWWAGEETYWGCVCKEMQEGPYETCDGSCLTYDSDIFSTLQVPTTFMFWWTGVFTDEACKADCIAYWDKGDQISTTSACIAGTSLRACSSLDGENLTCTWTCDLNQSCGDCYECIDSGNPDRCPGEDCSGFDINGDLVTWSCSQGSECSSFSLRQCDKCE